jgi:hypothetical protein
MRTVTFKSVIDGICRALAYDPARDLNASRFAALTEYVNQRVIEGVKFEFWPELMATEQRFYRPKYDATEAVTAGAERFFFPANAYYQALQASTGQLPSTTTDGVNYTENSAYWAVSAASYTGTLWIPGLTLAVGNKVQNPNDGLIYQCIVAHTTGATFDATKFGVLTPLDKYVAYDQAGQTPLDEVRGAYRRNPKTFTNNPAPLDFVPSDKGVQFDWRAPVSVWLNFRQRPPQFSSTLRSDAVSYAAGVTLYDSATQDCWTSTAAITPGQSPTSTPSRWQKVLFPALLASFVKRAALADALRDQKQGTRADDELAQAYEELQDLQDRTLAAQGQFDTAGVVAYGGGPRASYSNYVTLTSVKQ